MCLVADRSNDAFQCYWYTGPHDIQLMEHASAATARDAVTWGRARTPRVRIRTRDARSQWAGIEPRPATFTVDWDDADLAGTAVATSPRTAVSCAPLLEKIGGRTT